MSVKPQWVVTDSGPKVLHESLQTSLRLKSYALGTIGSCLQYHPLVLFYPYCLVGGKFFFW